MKYFGAICTTKNQLVNGFTMNVSDDVKVPHTIPYQGSKRKLAPRILEFCNIENIETFYEPFAGSAAVTLAAASHNMATEFHINEILCPLAKIWEMIINNPEELARLYTEIWNGQIGKEPDYYYQIRNGFNLDQSPEKLLYLLARCVKNAVRFNSNGEFNQSADKRRLGTKPETMNKNIFNTFSVLQGRASISCDDYKETLKNVSRNDFVYMDPPWQGTSTGKDNRYFASLDKEKLFDEMRKLNDRSVPFILSFDGRCGSKSYGDGVPADLNVHLVELHAGRSSQATLSGKDDVTVESLYLSEELVSRLGNEKIAAYAA